MAELLHLERLALGCLREAGVATAEAQVLEGDGFVFLELVRFDRQGPLGRLGMVSAGAIADGHFGRRDSWSAFARSCAAARLLTAQDELRIHTMAAFSELIGNNDRHFDNLSLMLDGRGGIAAVAPAYDILPMQYAPIGGGLEPPLNPVEPRLGAIGGLPGVWLPAARAALAFWRRVVNDPGVGVSAPMRAVAARNLDVVQAFVAPWGGARVPAP